MDSVMFDSAPITLPRILASHKPTSQIRNMLDGIPSPTMTPTTSSSNSSLASSSRARSNSFGTRLSPPTMGSFARISPLATSSHTDPTSIAPSAAGGGAAPGAGKQQMGRARRAVTEMPPMRGSIHELREAHDRQYKAHLLSPSPSPSITSTTSTTTTTTSHPVSTLAHLPPGARDTILAGLTPLGTSTSASEKPHDSAVDMSDLSIDRLTITQKDTPTSSTSSNSSNSSNEEGTNMEKAIIPPTKPYAHLPPPSYVNAVRLTEAEMVSEGRPRSHSSPCQLLPIVEMEDQAAFGV